MLVCFRCHVSVFQMSCWCVSDVMLVFQTACWCVSDGMLSHENEEMKERVIALEKKVHQQEDELLCLKSALSDAIRRLSAVEANRRT